MKKIELFSDAVIISAGKALGSFLVLYIIYHFGKKHVTINVDKNSTGDTVTESNDNKPEET